MWVSTVKAKGRKYAYLSIYENEDFRKRKAKNVYSLGKVEEAVPVLEKWESAPETIPGALKRKGLNPGKIPTWIKKLEKDSLAVV
ncbi:hypothetical protein U3A55_02390 [Salarchaeum sp. III]|uniref:hypothetical protein n=1 Tax=Salarchaeum sp. III TaxID=3107927 RepID=UPI002ED9C390